MGPSITGDRTPTPSRPSTGTVFRISLPGEVFTTIHAFAPRDGATGIYPEGAGPYAGLTRGNDNTLYGTTSFGGTGQCGTIFRITPAGVLTTLYSLQQVDGCAPNAGLTLATDGIFYGTASSGGTLGSMGTVFITTIHAWAYPLAGGAPVFLGAAEYGLRRLDVGAIYGRQFEHSGFQVGVSGLPHGHYDLALFPWSTVTGRFETATVVRVTVR